MEYIQDTKKARRIIAKIRRKSVAKKKDIAPGFSYTTATDYFAGSDISTQSRVFNTSIEIDYNNSPNISKTLENVQSTDQLPIPHSKCCKLLGRAPFFEGSRPGGVIYPSLMSSYFSNKFVDYTGIEKNVHDYAMVQGNFKHTRPYFSAMGTDRILKETPTIFEIEKMLRHFIRDAKLPIINEIPNILSIANVTITKKTSPGLRYKKFTSNNNKKDALYWGKLRATMIMDGLRKEQLYSRSIYTAGARVKRSDGASEYGGNKTINRDEDGYSEGSKEVSSRGVLEPELDTHIIGSMISRPIEEIIHRTKESSIKLGGGMSKFGWVDFKNKVQKSDFIFEGDWRKFDTTVPEWILSLAFSVVRACYPEDEYLDRIFNYIKSEFIHKNLIIPGALLYRMRRGIPSGHPMTSLIGSIVNGLILSDIIANSNQKQWFEYDIRDVSYFVSGDDFVVFYENIREVDRPIPIGIRWLDMIRMKKWVRQSVYKKKKGTEFLFRNFIKRRYAMEVKNGKDINPNVNFEIPEGEISKDDLHRFSLYVDSMPCFLKTTIIEGKPMTAPSHLYERMLMPNSICNNRSKELNLAESLHDSFGYPGLFSALLIEYARDVYKSFNGEIPVQFSYGSLLKTLDDKYESIYCTVRDLDYGIDIVSGSKMYCGRVWVSRIEDITILRSMFPNTLTETELPKHPVRQNKSKIKTSVMKNGVDLMRHYLLE